MRKGSIWEQPEHVLGTDYQFTTEYCQIAILWYCAALLLWTGVTSQEEVLACKLTRWALTDLEPFSFFIQLILIMRYFLHLCYINIIISKQYMTL